MEQYFEEMTSQYELNDDVSPLKSWNNSKLSPDKVSEEDDDDSNNDSGGFDCNICLESLQDPVITFCGHMYCWPCIYKWIHSQTISSEKPEYQEPQCPVCKAGISEKTLIPVYGRGQSKKSSDTTAQDLGSDIPKRPQGPRCTDSHPGHQHPQLHQEYYGYPGGLGTGTDLSQPMIGMFGELVYGRMFGNSEATATLSTYPNSYRLAGTTGRRMRRRMMAVDRSLNRISSFLFCCMVLCLLLF